jgi:hypothetical protein
MSCSTECILVIRYHTTWIFRLVLTILAIVCAFEVHSCFSFISLVASLEVNINAFLKGTENVCYAGSLAQHSFSDCLGLSDAGNLTSSFIQPLENDDAGRIVISVCDWKRCLFSALSLFALVMNGEEDLIEFCVLTSSCGAIRPTARRSTISSAWSLCRRLLIRQAIPTHSRPTAITMRSIISVASAVHM